MTDDVHAAVEHLLSGAGQRYTSKRCHLIEALRRIGRPAAIGDLVSGRRGLPQSSVYRNLSVLEHVGAVRRVITEEGVARYELAEDLTTHHHHLVCRSCGTVEDVTMPARLERTVERTLAEAAAAADFEGAVHRVDLIGTCRDCRDVTA
ncbi:MAG TPA: transcriptional repressor [Actinomycetota bacterium]|nr:transcriptional repressor [Actinomycetota bacterium]